MQQNDDPISSSSEEEDYGADFKKIDDMALFIKKYHKGLKSNGYKLVQRRFPNKKKRTCYNCGSTEHFIANYPYEKKNNNYKKDNHESKHEHKQEYKRKKKPMGEAHIGHEWDSSKESSEEDVKIATVAIQKTSSTPRLFNNMSDDDDYHSSHICLMAKGEKVKLKATSPSSPSLGDISSEDDVSSDEELNEITRKLDPSTKIFIIKTLEDLESVQAELAARDDDLLAQEKLYIACKEALALERSEVSSLRKALANEQREHALTKKANIALNDKYCALDEKHKDLEM
jgi:hypothetical protein